MFAAESAVYYGLAANDPARVRVELVTEAILSRAFSRYEYALEQLFLSYCMGKLTRSGAAVTRYIAAPSVDHAHNLLKGRSQFLDWNSPDVVISRCELVFDDANPVKTALTANKGRLSRIRHVRNAIAHSSEAASYKYESAVRTEIITVGINIPTPGQFLLLAPAGHGSYLEMYIDTLELVIDVAAA